MVIVFLILFFIFFVMFIVTKRKYKRLLNKLEITDNKFISDSIRRYDFFKASAVKVDTTELRDLMLDYFMEYDILINNYFYPRIEVDENEK